MRKKGTRIFEGRRAAAGEKMEIDYVMGRETEEMFGINKYLTEIEKRIGKYGINYNKIAYSPSKNRSVERALRYAKYPFLVAEKCKKANVKHVTSQGGAYLLHFLNLKPCIVTCYDVIALSDSRGIKKIFNRWVIEGVKKADKIVTISEFSKGEIVEKLKYPEEKIEIVYPAVDHDVFKPIEGKERIRKMLGLDEKEKIILYVGSEQPRQEFPALIKAFAEVKKQFRNVKLIKIGKPQWDGAREENIGIAREEGLEIGKDVKFIDYVSEGQLPLWYNAADVFVYPCSYAGFGIPPLEAMACGVPAITSNVTSLPEIALKEMMTEPKDSEAIAEKIEKLLDNEKFRETIAKKSLERSKMFSWERSARKMAEIYMKMKKSERRI